MRVGPEGLDIPLIPGKVNVLDRGNSGAQRERTSCWIGMVSGHQACIVGLMLVDNGSGCRAGRGTTRSNKCFINVIQLLKLPK